MIKNKPGDQKITLYIIVQFFKRYFGTFSATDIQEPVSMMLSGSLVYFLFNGKACFQHIQQAVEHTPFF